MKAIHAIYENGVFRPTEPVDLPDASHVVFEPKLLGTAEPPVSLDEIYALLRQRFDSGQRDVAARHDEHQP